MRRTAEPISAILAPAIWIKPATPQTPRPTSGMLDGVLLLVPRVVIRRELMKDVQSVIDVLPLELQAIRRVEAHLLQDVPIHLVRALRRIYLLEH